MASVKDMRTRIRSVQSTQKITKALQMVAAAKLRRTQDAAQANVIIVNTCAFLTSAMNASWVSSSATARF